MPRRVSRVASLEALARERALTEPESRALEYALRKVGLLNRQMAFCFTPDLSTHTRRGKPRRRPTWEELDAISRTRALTLDESRRLERSLYAKG